MTAWAYWKGYKMELAEFGRRDFLRVGAYGLAGTYAAAALASCSDDSGSTAANGDSDDLRQVHFLLDFTPKGYHAPFYMALERGLWAERGLSVQISRGFGSSDTAVRIGGGEGHFGFASIPDTLRTAGEGISIVEIAPLITRDADAVMAHPDNTISSPDDLIGLQGAADPDEDPTQTYLAAFLDQNGLDINDLDWAGVSDAGLSTIVAGQADLVLDWITELPAWWLQDPPLEPSTLWHGGELDVYGNSIMTRPEVIEENPDLARRFVEGVAEAYKQVIEGDEAVHEEAIDLLFRYNPELEEQPNARDFHLNNLKLMLSLIASAEETAEGGLCYFQQEKLDRTAEIINEYVLDEPVSPEEAFIAVDDQVIESGQFVIDDREEVLDRYATIMDRPNPLLA